MTTTVGAENWMWAAEDGIPLCHMSIPGTHESCALHGGGPTECQALTITQQLQRGIRFLDVRCKYVSDDDATVFFPVHHGNIYQETTFSQVQQQCVEFLSVHKQEVIIMNVQQEEHWYASDHGYLVPGDQFEAKFLDLIDRRYWSFPESIPTLGQFRGQILLLRTYHVLNTNPLEYKGWTGSTLPGGKGLEWSGFDISGESEDTNFKTQNGWNAWDGGEKGDKVEKYLEDAAAGVIDPDKIYLNFLSHTQGEMKTNSVAMNNRISNKIKTGLRTPINRLGILPMDFCGNTLPGAGSLEDLIIQHNRFKGDFVYSYVV